jgi:MOSC domain-containing protein YiiM
MLEVRLLELRVGTVRTVKGLRSAIFKAAVSDPLWLGREGLAGDEVADHEHHGGPDQAVLAYPASNYPLWAEEGRVFERGDFGENLLLEGLREADACIGDIFEGLEVRLQIAHPRVPCGTLAKRLESAGILHRVWETGRGGFYLRVLQEGRLQPGETLRRVSQPNPEWNVVRALHAQWRVGTQPAEALALAALPELSGHWRARLPRQAGA